MKRGWNVLKNLLILWKYFYIMRRCAKEIKDYGMLSRSVMDELTEEQVEGFKTSTELYRLLTMEPKTLATDFKLLDRLLKRWDKKN